MATNKPEKHFRFGAVRASVWCDVRNGPSGQPFKSWSVTLDRAYKDAQGEWQNTHSLKEADIPKAVLALERAFEFITSRNEGDDAGE